MKKPLLMLVLLTVAASKAQTPRDSCVTCHLALDGDLARPAQLFEQDVHRKNGFSCADCHGGDPSSDDVEKSMSRSRGFVGKIDRRSVPARCARCHADANLIHRYKPQQRVDQLAQYRTSVHGQRLAAGDTRVANCTDYHGVHDIREVRDAASPVHPLRVPGTCARCHADPEHMRGYGIPTDQFDKYQRSVHWQALAKRGDLSAPGCATCHGNHGAAPPGVASVAHVCGSCHVVFENLFTASPHKAAFDSMGLAGCVVCHSNHEVIQPTADMLGVQPGATCTNCHVEGDKGYEAARVMRARLDDLAIALRASGEILRRAATSGMEVSEAQTELDAAQESLVKARVDVHSFIPAQVEAEVKKGLAAAESSRRASERALAERDYRRKGLALSLVAIGITMAGLWLAIRELESRSRMA